MQCNAKAGDIVGSEETMPVVLDLRSLWHRLGELSDRRRDRGKGFGLALVLLLV